MRLALIYECFKVKKIKIVVVFFIHVPHNKLMFKGNLCCVYITHCAIVVVFFVAEKLLHVKPVAGQDGSLGDHVLQTVAMEELDLLV